MEWVGNIHPLLPRQRTGARGQLFLFFVSPEGTIRGFADFSPIIRSNLKNWLLFP
jgi:hypothetical protein